MRLGPTSSFFIIIVIIFRSCCINSFIRHTHSFHHYPTVRSTPPFRAAVAFFFGTPRGSSIRNTRTGGTIRSRNNMVVSNQQVATEVDPYLDLEEIESESSLAFAKACNDACLERLGNPEHSSSTYAKILQILESQDRIPSVSQYGISRHQDKQEGVLYNFWKDATHPKGIWRRTTRSSYAAADNASAIEWETVLDVDQLAQQDEISWVWKGNTPLPRSRDVVAPGSQSPPSQVTRSLISLSNGGSDAVSIKEFDLTTNSFVTGTDSFEVMPEGKVRVSYKSRNVVLIGCTHLGPDTVTSSGYPRQIREWVRGTLIEEAPVVFEGQVTDVSVGMYVVDERSWYGKLYEVQYRSLTFYTSKYWIRSIPPEYMLAPNDPIRIEYVNRGETVQQPGAFIPLNIQDDASISFVGKMLIITLRSDWKLSDAKTYQQGSVIYTDIDTFVQSADPSDCTYTVLFAPTDRTAYEYFTVTKNYFILSTMENVKSKLTFYKIDQDGSLLVPLLPRSASGENAVAEDAQIRDCTVRPVDPYLGSDEFWFTTSDYVTPSTLYMASATKMDPDHDDFNSDNDATKETRLDPFITAKLKSLPDQYDSSNVMVEQRTAISKDGTEIPYFIVMPKDIVYNGQNPTLLYGYGGFEVSLGAHYIASSGVAWLERGCGSVYVEANIRGGGEFGPKWHQAGLKENRNKCYEDFIAVAEHLIASNICTPKTLAARGGSNGGLLMGNMYVQRPDLFGAIHCAVPLLDMKRYHTLLAGASWMAEYGNPDTEDWSFMEQYSPYHNIDPRADYPPILVTTSTRDDRVHPGHARKFVKKLMDTNPSWPVYYYENIEGGHGGAADAKQNAFMTSLAYDFMFTTLRNNIAPK